MPAGSESAARLCAERQPGSKVAERGTRKEVLSIPPPQKNEQQFPSPEVNPGESCDSIRKSSHPAIHHIAQDFPSFFFVFPGYGAKEKNNVTSWVAVLLCNFVRRNDVFFCRLPRERA
jgi:hypothetical protein